MPSRHDRRSRRAANALLAASIAGALNTLNAERPLSRTGRAGVLSFATGFLTSELPWHTIGVQAAGLAGFVRRGALRTLPGRLALGLTLASWARLVTIDRRNRRSGPIFDRALDEVFPPATRAAAGPGADTPVDVLAAAESAVLDRRRLALGPFAPHRRHYVRPGEANIAYGPAGRRNKLDIWRRSDLPADAKAPVLVQVHGGAWLLGNKQQQAMPLLAHLCERGWVCVAINYRLSPRATWPDHVVDVKRAIAWVKEHIADYGGDPDFVAITGGSAGGHLASLAALTPNEPMFQPGFESADTSLAAAVPFYGVYDFTNRDGTGRPDMLPLLARLVLKVPVGESPDVWDTASPMSWIGPDAPPMFVVHGTNDSLVPIEQARAFVAMLRAASRNPVAFAELPGTQHAFETFESPHTVYSAAAVTRFLETIRQSPALPRHVQVEPARESAGRSRR